ncbi:hypothetical protein Tco_0244454, partial [Tanacetum coccineum]
TASVTITAAEPVSAAAKDLIDFDMKIAEALAELKTSKPKVITTAPVLTVATTITTTRPTAKGITIQEPSAELEEEAKRQEKASIAAINELYDDVQAHIDADQELSAKLTHEDHEKYTVEERAKMLAEFFKNRRKQIAAERT